jgi:hypothetical protein
MARCPDSRARDISGATSTPLLRRTLLPRLFGGGRFLAPPRALSGRPRLRVLGEPVRNPNPGQFAAGIRVVARRQGFGMIEAAGRDVDLIGMIVALKSQLRPAVGTEAPRCLSARSEACRIARHKPKLGRTDAEPGDERRACGSPADRTVAIRCIERRAAHFVTNSAAEAPAQEHVDELRTEDNRGQHRNAGTFLKLRGARRRRARIRRTGSTRHRGST